MTEELERIATAMLTPVRGEPVNSAVRWELRETLESRFGPIAYWVSGSGPTVLLVHGWEGTHAHMDAFVAPLLARGARVVAVDLPAHGESSGTTASLAECGEMLALLGTHLGPLRGAIGHSAGSPSLAIALRNGLHAQRVALIATPERYDRYVRWVAEQESVDVELLLATLRARGFDASAFVLPEMAPSLNAAALIVHSVDDRTCMIEGARRVAEAWPGSEFLQVDGLGHSRILKDPAVIERVVQFVLLD
jgi:pimeloyl-ACP methyl ester carboxylesterase